MNERWTRIAAVGDLFSLCNQYLERRFTGRTLESRHVLSDLLGTKHRILRKSVRSTRSLAPIAEGGLPVPESLIYLVSKSLCKQQKQTTNNSSLTGVV